MSYFLDGDRNPLAFLRKHAPSYRDAVDMCEQFPNSFEMPRFLQENSCERDTVGESNARVWRKDFADTEGITWWDLGSAVLVRTLLLLKAEREALQSLGDYPLLDEDDHSELETEYEGFDWDNYGRGDFRDELVKRVHESDREHARDIVNAAEDKDLDSLYWDWCRGAEEYYPERQNEGTSFMCHEVIRSVTDQKVKWYDESISRWDGTIQGLQELLDPYLADNDGVPLWIAVADTLEFIQLVRESEVSASGELDGCRVKDENGDYVLESGTRYIVVRETVRVDGDETVKLFMKAS